MKFRNLALGIVLFAASAFAADIDGKWSGSLDTPNGAVQIAFTFKADGATLTGTSSGPDGMEIKIEKGKIDGNNISFEVTVDFGGMQFTVPYTGVLSGENLALKAEFFGMPFEIAVKKSA